MVLEMLELNRSAVEEYNVLPLETMPTATSVNVPSSEVPVPDIEVKKEVVSPDSQNIFSDQSTRSIPDISILKNNAETRLPTQSVSVPTIIVVQPTIPQGDLINGGCLFNSLITSTDQNLKGSFSNFQTDINLNKPVQLTEFTPLGNQVLTTLGMNCPLGVTVNNSDSAVCQMIPASDSTVPTETNKSITKQEVVDIDSEAKSLNSASSCDDYEDRLPNVWSSNDESKESLFSYSVLEEEVDLLLDALKSYPELLHKSPSDFISRKKLWRKVAKQLNFKGSGIWRSTKAVQQKWTSLKCRVKKKFMAIQESKFAFEDLKGTVMPLSVLDKKVLSALNIDYSKELEMEDSIPLPTNSTEKIVSTTPSIVDTTVSLNGTNSLVSSTSPVVSSTTLVANGATLIVNGPNLASNGAALASSCPASAINYGVPLVDVAGPAKNDITPAISSTSLLSSGITPISNATVPAISGITPIINVVESNERKGTIRSEGYLKARVHERQKSTARVNFHRQRMRGVQKKKEDELLALKRESIKIKRQTLEEHRKTNILLQRILQLKCQETKTQCVDLSE